jgi:trimeric autotransporter adhesin
MKKSFTLTVVAVMLSFASFAVSAITGTKTLCLGGTTTLFDSTTGGTWTSGGTAVAAISSGGVVTGISAGTAIISYTVLSTTVIATVTVNPLPATIGGASIVCAGSSITLTDATTGGVWSSGSSSIASVNPTSGVVTGNSPGVTNIYYALPTGCGAFHTVTVTGSVITGPSSVCIGSTIALSDATTGGSWFSGSTSKATVSSGGVVTGISAGTSLISYYVGGCVATKTITVSSGAPAITGPTSVCVGSAIMLFDSLSGGTWSSSNTSIATIGSVSVVTGISAGTVTVTYTLSGCTATTVITVKSLPSAISGPSTVCAGSAITLSDATGGGIWTSSNTARAAVSSGGIVTGVSAGVVTISFTMTTGCGVSRTVTVTGGSSISGSSSVCIGSTITLMDSTTGGSWFSGSSAVATVSSGGVVTGISAGTCLISYYVGGCIVTKSITVTSGAPAISGPSTVCVGSTITETDALTGGAWTTSTSTVATITSTGGVITGVSAGTANIYYAVGGCYAYKTVTVTGSSTITGPSTVCAGSTIALSDATTGGFWFSGNTAIATVGTSGVVTGVSSGTVTIYYGLGGCYAPKTITVTGGSSSITGPSTVCVGSTITLMDSTTGGTWITSGTTTATVSSGGVVTGISPGVVSVYYIVGGCYAFHSVTVTTGAPSIGGTKTVCVGSTTTLTDAASGGTWSSSATSIATVGLTTGIVTGIAAGTVTISYKLSGGCFAVTTVTVTASSTITGPSTVCVGSAITLSDGTPGGFWFSSNTAIATVGTSGVVTGVSSGTFTIYYGTGGCYATKTITVTGGASIIGSSTVCVGSTITLIDSITGGTWFSGSTATATVSTGGIVTGVSAGTCLISYYVSGCLATKTVTVTGGSSITGPSTVCAGSSITLSDAVSGGSWFSSSSSIATVSTGGVVTGVSAGTCTISYYASGCLATKTITVTGGSSITGPSTLCVGSTITLSDALSGGTWITSSTATATVSSGGVVTGISAGTANIYYIVGGCYAYHTVTVTSGAPAIGGTTTVCVGLTTTLTDAGTGGSWTSSNTSIATIGMTSGIVTGIAAGTVTVSYSMPGGCIATTVVTVTGSSTITGPSTVCVGSSVTLSDAIPGGTWLSSSTTTATVSSGVVTGMAAGTLSVYYIVGSCYGFHTMTVTSGASISGPSTVCTGSTITLSSATTGGIWTSGSTAVAVVSSGGIVTGASAGVVNIYYSVGGCYGYHSVTVTATPTIYGPSSVCIGSTIVLSDAATGGTWSSSNTAIAGISTGGVVTGMSSGIATISYYKSGCVATHTVTVSGTGAIAGPSSVTVGSTITLSDPTSGGTWLSSNTSLATVSSGGVVTGVSTGSVIIYYVIGGCGAYKNVTVTASGPGALSGLVLTGGAKGTSADIPVVGMLINLTDVGNNVLQYTNTDNTGAYSFTNLADGDYIIYPYEATFTTIPSPVMSISSTRETISGVNFRQDATTKTITPRITGVTSIVPGGELTIYPNPTSGELNIKWDNQSMGDANVCITDIVGREVFKSVININATSGQEQLKLSGINNGIYFITVKSDNIYYSGKLIIQK